MTELELLQKENQELKEKIKYLEGMVEGLKYYNYKYPDCSWDWFKRPLQPAQPEWFYPIQTMEYHEGVSQTTLFDDKTYSGC